MWTLAFGGNERSGWAEIIRTGVKSALEHKPYQLASHCCRIGGASRFMEECAARLTAGQTVGIYWKRIASQVNHRHIAPQALRRLVGSSGMGTSIARNVLENLQFHRPEENVKWLGSQVLVSKVLCCLLPLWEHVSTNSGVMWIFWRLGIKWRENTQGKNVFSIIDHKTLN